MLLSLVIPSFVAGMLMFLAPCTLPLVPGYLAFIGGVSLRHVHEAHERSRLRRRMLANGIAYVLGFSAVFIFFGTVVGLGGAVLLGYRRVLARIGGVVVIFFGILLVGGSRWKPFAFLSMDHRMVLPAWVRPGSFSSSFLFGVSFALGWTPCIGPILGTILTLAGSSSSVLNGIVLLSVFSLGLAIPFLLCALAIGSAQAVIRRLNPILSTLSALGGVLIIVLGVLLATDTFGLWTAWVFRVLWFVPYDHILNFL